MTYIKYKIQNLVDEGFCLNHLIIHFKCYIDSVELQSEEYDDIVSIVNKNFIDNEILMSYFSNLISSMNMVVVGVKKSDYMTDYYNYFFHKNSNNLIFITSSPASCYSEILFKINNKEVFDKFCKEVLKVYHDNTI